MDDLQQKEQYLLSPNYVSNLHPATYPDGNDVEVMRIASLESAWKNAAHQSQFDHVEIVLVDEANRKSLADMEQISVR